MDLFSLIAPSRQRNKIVIKTIFLYLVTGPTSIPSCEFSPEEPPARIKAPLSRLDVSPAFKAKIIKRSKASRPTAARRAGRQEDGQTGRPVAGSIRRTKTDSRGL